MFKVAVAVLLTTMLVLCGVIAFAQTGYWANQPTAYERARDAANQRAAPAAPDGSQPPATGYTKTPPQRDWTNVIQRPATPAADQRTGPMRDWTNVIQRPVKQGPPQQRQTQPPPDRTNMAPVTINGETHWFPIHRAPQPQQGQPPAPSVGTTACQRYPNLC